MASSIKVQFYTVIFHQGHDGSFPVFREVCRKSDVYNVSSRLLKSDNVSTSMDSVSQPLIGAKSSDVTSVQKLLCNNEDCLVTPVANHTQLQLH